MDDENDVKETALKGVKMDYINFKEYNLCRGCISDVDLQLVLNSSKIPDKRCELLKKYKHLSYFGEYYSKQNAVKNIRKILDVES